MKLTAKLTSLVAATLFIVGTLTGCAEEEAAQAQTQDVSQSAQFEYRARQVFDQAGIELTFLVNDRPLLLHLTRPTSDQALEEAMEAMNLALQDPARMVVLPTPDNWPVREDSEHQLVLVDAEDPEEMMAVGLPSSREDAEQLRDALLEAYRPARVAFDLWNRGPCGFGIFAFEDEFYAGRFDVRTGAVSYYSPAADSPEGARQWAQAAASAAAEPWNWTSERMDDGTFRAVLHRSGQTLLFGAERYLRRRDAEDATLFMVCF